MPVHLPCSGCLLLPDVMSAPWMCVQDLSWNAGKKFMGNVDGFLKSLLNFDKDNIPGPPCCLVQAPP